MLSRVADSLYWISRYMERAENVARFVDVNIHMALDVPGDSGTQWQPLVDASGDRESFQVRYGAASRDNVIRFLTFDETNPNSILSCIRTVRENARWIRQFITLEMWEQINEFYLMMEGASTKKMDRHAAHDFLEDVMMASQLFSGITDATMSHGEGWHFCRLGRMLERADKTSRILDVKYFHLFPSPDFVRTPFDDILWAAVLRSISALEMYRKQHHQILPAAVLDFLILDREFPRAIHHCAIVAEESLRAISGTPGATFHNQAERLLGKLRSELDYTQVEEIIDGGVHEFLDGVQARLNAVGAAVQETFFALRPLAGAPGGQVRRAAE
ncbi:MAG: alpha-E domain-containing protein [bacterium]|nr:alpha-E domain-containing protein [bacterium]